MGQRDHDMALVLRGRIELKIDSIAVRLLLKEAADEIERLQAIVEGYEKKEAGAWRKSHDRISADVSDAGG